MKDLLTYITKQIVDKPEEVKIEQTEEEENLVLLNLTVAPEDMGKVIGKGGSIINAIRQILLVKAIKQGKRVALKLNEPDQKEFPGQPAPPEEEKTPSQTGKADSKTPAPRK